MVFNRIIGIGGLRPLAMIVEFCGPMPRPKGICDSKLRATRRVSSFTRVRSPKMGPILYLEGMFWKRPVVCLLVLLCFVWVGWLVVCMIP